MQSFFKRAYRKRSVFGGIVRQHDRIHIMIYKFFEIVIISYIVVADILFNCVQYFRIFVAYGNQTCIVRRLAIANHAYATVAAHNAYFYFLFHFNTFLVGFHATIISLFSAFSMDIFH